MNTSIRNVDFGVSKTGLSTVGFRLINSNGTEYAARTTAGVVATLAGTGMYHVEISTPDDWVGMLVWDTGEATPKYASDAVNLAPSGTGTGGSQSTFYAGVDPEALKQLKSDIKKLLLRLNKVISLIDQGTVATKETLTSVAESLKMHVIKHSSLHLEANFKDLKETISSEIEVLESISEAIILLTESQEVKDLIQEVESDVENQLTQR